MGTTSRSIWLRTRVIAFTNSLSVDTQDFMGVNIYPNPMKDNRFIIGSSKLNGSRVNVSITNMLGQTIYRENHDFIGNELVIYPDLTTGIYVVKIEGNGQESTHRIVKQ